MIVAFTGHRSPKVGGYILPNPTYDYIVQELTRILTELKPEKAISGMALGFDQFAAATCIRLGIPFIAAIPFVGQESRWFRSSKEAYQALLKRAAEVVVVSEGSHSLDKFQIRNEWMVDRCDTLIACWDGSLGGTGNCVRYAEELGKPIVFIDPRKATP